MSGLQALEIEGLEALVDQSNRQELRLLLNDRHPADIAESLSHLDQRRRLFCFRLLDLDNASSALAELDPEIQRQLLQELGDVGVIPIISHMPPDDAVDLLAELPREKVDRIMAQMTDIEAVQDIEELLGFKEDSAGGIMSTDYLALEASMTAAEALQQLRAEYKDIGEEIYDIFVTDLQEALVGKITVRELLTAPAGARVDSLMDRDVITVNTDTDQELAAEKLGRYDLLSLPVIDETGKLRGIITADDVFDVLQEEATEDIFESSGISTTGPEANEELAYNVPLAFRARLPWLMATVCIEAGAVGVINHFDAVIRQTVAAAAFMPLLSGTTGSVATQSTCIIIRGTATGHINWRAAWRTIFHELKVGFLLGVACGLATWLLGHYFHGVSQTLGLVVAASLCLTMLVGVATGTIMPLLFHRLGIDPAHASGPFITSILDVSTMSIYLTVVHFCLAHVV